MRGSALARERLRSTLFVLGILLQAGAGLAVAAEEGAAPAGVTVEPAQPRMGDAIHLTVTAGGPEAGMAEAPAELKPGGEFGPFRVLGIETGAPGVLGVRLMPLEAGALALPGFEAVFVPAGKEERKVAVPPRTISVASVLGEGDATLADLKPPAELPVPWPWKAILLGALAAAAVAAAGYLLARRLRRPRPARPLPEEELPPGVTADAWVRERLAELLARRLLEAGHHREFHIELSDLIRRYLELRYRVPALERTTEEVAEEMARALIDPPAVATTVAMLERCDRVKFAKHVPPSGEAAGTVGLAREVIERTAPPPAPVAMEPGATPAGSAA